jgi:hypothetical protein
MSDTQLRPASIHTDHSSDWRYDEIGKTDARQAV